MKIKINNAITIRLLLTNLILITTFFSIAQTTKKNVLFIMVDDLKPDLGCYGNTFVKSPNIDLFAKSATVFNKAYCQQAICGPTRASILTSLRPDQTKIWDLKAKLRTESPDVISLPQHFKNNGYVTIGMGKVFDPSNVDKFGDEKSWTLPFKKSFPLAKGYEEIAFEIYQSKKIKDIVRAEGNIDKGEGEFFGPNKNQSIRYSVENEDVPDNAYMDGAMADDAVKQLEQLQKSKQPFFMAIGFKKPHLPFVAPKKYWDLYQRDNIALAPFQQKAANSPAVAYHNSGELRNYKSDIQPLPDVNNLMQLDSAKQKELIHGYYACISYMDAQLGKVLNALKKYQLDKNTIVVLLGDHGWHLGDHSLWCKHSNFEQATKVPLIIKAERKSATQQFNGLVEYVDVFPTVCGLANVALPKKLEGQSLAQVISNKKTVWNKKFAISQYPRGAGEGPKETMGYSIRNERYRLTEWVKGFTTNKVFNETDVIAIELYDYKTDALETKNIANEANAKMIVDSLKKELHNYYQQQYNKTK